MPSTISDTFAELDRSLEAIRGIYTQGSFSFHRTQGNAGWGCYLHYGSACVHASGVTPTEAFNRARQRMDEQFPDEETVRRCAAAELRAELTRIEAAEQEAA